MCGSRTHPGGTGFNLCSAADEPCGSDQAAASAPKWAASCGLIVAALMSRDVAPCLAPCKKFYPSHVFTRLPSPSPFRNDANAAEMLEKVAVETRSGKRGDMARIVMKFGGPSMEIGRAHV